LGWVKVSSILLPCPACKTKLASSAHSCLRCGERLTDEWEKKGRTQLKRRRIVRGIFLVPLLLTVILFGSAIGVGIYREETAQPGPVSLSSKPNVADDRKVMLPPGPKEADSPRKEVPFLTKLEAVFVGRPAQSEIKRSMDQVLTSFEQPTSEENYKILGNVLVRMRKDTPGATEMSILKCMNAMNGALKPDFVAAAAICAVGVGR
jgi:hypothetical protein